MMTLRLLVGLACVAAALAQTHCESPPQWSSKNFYFSPVHGHVEIVEAHYTYDKLGQRKSFRELVPSGTRNGTYEPIHRIELFAENKEYVINDRTGECITYPIRFPFYPHDVPIDARFRGLFYVGSSAEAEGSVELEAFDTKFTSAFWDGSFTTVGCIPYHSNYYNASTFGVRFESIVDVSPGIDPNDFIPPAGCR